MLALFALPDWAAAVIGTAAVIGALAVVWRVVRFCSKIIYFVDTYGPVLVSIAEQFKKNGGNTLKDQLDRLEKKTESTAETAVHAHKAAKDAHDLVIRTDENVRTIRNIVMPASKATVVPVVSPTALPAAFPLG